VGEQRRQVPLEESGVPRLAGEIGLEQDRLQQIQIARHTLDAELADRGGRAATAEVKSSAWQTTFATSES